MLHRAGNVDGEGDGCGVLVDIPRKIWAEEVRAGGHNPALVARRRRSASPTSSSSAPQDLEKLQHDAREILGLAAASGSSPSASARSTRRRSGATAREEEPHFWQIGGLVADAERRERVFDLMIELERELGVPRRLVLGRRPASTR